MEFPPRLVLTEKPSVDPQAVQQQFDQDLNDLWFPISTKQGQAIKDHIKDLLEPFSKWVSATFLENFQKKLESQRLVYGSSLINFYDWCEAEWRKEINNRLEEYYKNRSSQEFQDTLYGFDQCTDEIYCFIRDHVQQLNKKLESSSKKEDYNRLWLEHEAHLRQIEGASLDLDAFNQYNHIVDVFLRFSALDITFDRTTEFMAKWVLDGVTISEKFILEKSAALTRRVFTVDQNDLPYLSKQSPNSVIKQWSALAAKYNLTDQQLANYCLEFYSKGHIEAHQEIKEFVAFLVILLLEKETALDKASLLANFILLYSVKLDLQSFKKALKTMPLIPGGAVAIKQFILHITQRDLDCVAWVEPSKKLESNYFLTCQKDFVGPAEEWIDKYDDVTTMAVECCVELLAQSPLLSEADPEIAELKHLLEELYGDSLPIPVEDLPKALAEEGHLMDFEDKVGAWVLKYMFNIFSQMVTPSAREE